MAAAVTWDLDSEAEDAYENFVAGFRLALQTEDEQEGVPVLPLVPRGRPELIMVDYNFLDNQIDRQLRVAYTRHNIYLMGYRGSNDRWWEFLHTGEALIAGSTRLRYGPGYLDMGDLEVGFNVGRLAIINAVRQLWRGDIPDSERKRCLKVMIVVGPESARLDPVFTLVNTAFPNWENANLGQIHCLLIKDWSTLCSQLYSRDDTLPDHPLRLLAGLVTYQDVANVVRLCLRK